MFVGHLAAGLVAKRVEPRISLGTWTLAVMLADLLTFPLMLAGIEHFDVAPGATSNRFVGRDIVYSHSLLMGAIWATLFAAAYYMRRRYPRGAWLLSLAVLSHWLLDFVSHRPDMPLAPGVSVVLGLGLWNSLPLTLIVEGGFWTLAIILYVRATQAKRVAGVYVFWSGIALFTLLWYGNIRQGMDPDPIRAGVGGLVVFSLLVGWAYFVNRLRAAGTEIGVKAGTGH